MARLLQGGWTVAFWALYACFRATAPPVAGQNESEESRVTTDQSATDSGVPVPEPATDRPPRDPATDRPPPEAPTWQSRCERPESVAPFEPVEGEQCFEFRVHGASSSSDVSAFEVQTGENINAFYYAVPWPVGSVATRLRTAFDSEAAFFQTTFALHADQQPGEVSRNATGEAFGTDAVVLAMGGAGTCNQELPPDVGLALPDDGLIMIEWHFYNHLPGPQLDASAVQICTVPRGQRPHTAGLTILGTENLGGPGGFSQGKHAFPGVCRSDATEPITLLGFTPHMHRYGWRTLVVLERGGGLPVSLLDAPFQVEQQATHWLSRPFELLPGDRLTTTCAFDNDSGANITFGESARMERCHVLALAHPAGALDNHVSSLTGATNTCWETP